LEREAIGEAVERAVKLAKVHSRIMKKPIEFADARVGRAKYEAVQLKKFDSMSIEDKTDLLVGIWKEVLNSVKEVKVMTTTASFSESIEEKTIVNSDGAFVESRVPRLGVNYNFVLMHPQKGTIQRRYSYGGSGGLELLEEWNILEEASGEARVTRTPLWLEGLERRSPGRREVLVSLRESFLNSAVNAASATLLLPAPLPVMSTLCPAPFAYRSR